MKILLIGFLAFALWSLISTNIYVCQILGLCDDTETIQMVIPQSEAIIVDTLKTTALPKKAVAPNDLVIYFAFDKSEFRPDSLSEKYLDESKIYLNQDSLAMLNIAGYTDKTGSKEYNQALGYRRAQSIQHYFEREHVLSNRIILESFGENEPADNNNTIEGRANNRRTVITIKN